MPASRIYGIVLAAGALALATAAPAAALQVKMENVVISQYNTGAPLDDLPAAPKLTQPQQGPKGPKAPNAGNYSNTFSCIPASCGHAKPRPPMVLFQWGGNMPTFAPGRPTTAQLRRR